MAIDQEILDKLKEFANEMKEQHRENKKELSDIKNALQHMSDLYDTVLRDLTTQKSEITYLNKENKKLRDTVEKLEIYVNNQEQVSLSNQIEIVGLEEDEHESPKERALFHLTKNDTELQREDITNAYRTGRKTNNKSRILVVTLRNENTAKNTVTRNKRVVAPNVTSRKPKERNTAPVYVNHRLTAMNREILYLTKQKARDENFKYVWYKDAKIFCKKNETSRAHYIKSKSDIDNITN